MNIKGRDGEDKGGAEMQNEKLEDKDQEGNLKEKEEKGKGTSSLSM